MPHRYEDGSTSLLFIGALLVASLLGLQFLHQRAEKEMRAVAHDDFLVDKLKVKAGLRTRADCSAINLSIPCTVGQSLALPDQKGATLVAADGTTVIGSWNVKVECRASAVPEYRVLVARLNASAVFAKDPLTGKPMGWTELMPLKETCASAGGSSTVLLKSDPCYGAQIGNGSLPPEIVSASSCTGSSCLYHDKYCTDPQREFPSCPEGHQPIFRYVDRYGWGGIDFTKYTICSKM